MDNATRKELEAIREQASKRQVIISLLRERYARLTVDIPYADEIPLRNFSRDALQMAVNLYAEFPRLLAIIDEQEQQMRIEVTLGDKHYNTANQLLEGLIAAQAELGEAWQPIETAPKTNTEILVTNRRSGGSYLVHIVRWYNREGKHGWWGRNNLPEYPTYWQPLPAPPLALAERAGEQK